MPMKVDDVFESVGPFGRYQLLQVSVASLGSFACSLHVIIAIFHSITPDFRCKIPHMDNDSYTTSKNLDYWIPRDSQTGEYDSCLLYNHNSFNLTADIYSNSTERMPTMKCDEFVFDKQIYWGRTLAEEFRLVCDNRGLSTVAKVTFTSGMVVGAPLSGFLADMFGRRRVMIVLLIIGASLGTVATFSYNLIMYSILRFTISTSFVGLAGISNCIAMEITGPSKRPLAVTLRWAFWPVAQMLVSLLAYYIQDWQWLQLACSLPVFVCAGLQILFLKETPHFLVTKNRSADAVTVFKQMARSNKCLPPLYLEEDKDLFDQPSKREKLMKIFKAPVLLKRTIVFLFLWFIAGLGYVGLNFHVTHLTGSVYLNNVFSGLAELAMCLFIYLSHHMGRKLPVIGSLLLGSLSLISVAVMHAYLNLEAYTTPLVIVTMLGKFGISGVMAFDYFWSSELFPSVLRASLIGICSMFARFGSLLAPAIVDMYLFLETPFRDGLGLLVIGLTMLVGAALAVYLPETNNRKLPETIHDANTFMIKPVDSVASIKTKICDIEEVKEEVNAAYETSSFSD